MVDQNSGLTFDPELFERIDIEEYYQKRDKMVEVIDNFMDQLSYQLENEQYQIAGFNFNGGLVYEISFLYFTIAGTFAQQLFAKSSS